MPGEIIADDGESRSTPAAARSRSRSVNTGDRPIQIGSHYHFFETNKALEFDRGAAFGMRLDVPAGTAVRFEPGASKEVTLVEFGGSGELAGLNSLTDGSTARDRRSSGRRCAVRASAASRELEANGEDAPPRLRRHVRADDRRRRPARRHLAAGRDRTRSRGPWRRMPARRRQDAARRHRASPPAIDSAAGRARHAVVQCRA